MREIVHFIKRTLKRMDLTSRSFFALIEPGSCFAGTLFELALAADRSYMLDDPERPNTIALSGDERRPAADEQRPDAAARRASSATPARVGEAARARRSRSTRRKRSTPASCRSRPTSSTGTTRCGWRSRAAPRCRPTRSTGMEANLRFAGPETMETKIFGRLTAWQNWIFMRPNAVGEKGALTAYGSQSRPEFDFNRT